MPHTHSKQYDTENDTKWQEEKTTTNNALRYYTANELNGKIYGILLEHLS